MSWLYRVLKASTVRIDEHNRVSVDVLDTAALAERMELERSESERWDVTPEDMADNILLAAGEQAGKILADAGREADSMVSRRRAEFEDELQNLKEETLKEAFDQGYERGYLESKNIRAQAETVLRETMEERDRTLRNMEPELVDLIGKTVHKLIVDAAELNPQLIALLIRQGLDTANAPGDVVIHVSGADFEEAVKHKDDYFGHINTGARVDILKDPSLNKSDCVIETPYGNIDCSLERQFTALRDNLFYILENG